MRKLVVAALLAGCYSPHPQAGTPCPTGVCPDPLVCSPATQTCETTSLPAGDAPPPQPDAPTPDGPLPIDAQVKSAQLVQQAANHADADTLTITLPQAPAAGDVLIFIGGDIHSELDSASGVVGGAVPTWKRAAFSAINTNIEIWYGVSLGSTRDIVVHGIAGDTHAIFGTVSEWSGLTATLDGAIATDGLASPADPGSITTTNTHDIAFLGVADLTPNTYGNPTGGIWHALTGIDADVSIGVWWRNVGLPLTVHPTVSETANSWDAAVAAFEVAP